jgi:hypothetical protein
MVVATAMQLTKNLYRGFLKLTGGILTVTCLAKLVSVIGSAEALILPDPLFGWQNRWVMLLAAFTEAFVVGILLSKAASPTKLGSIFWLSLNFATYRVCLWLIGVTAPCPCMGSTYGLIGMDSIAMDRIMGSIVVALLTGSVYFGLKFHILNHERYGMLRAGRVSLSE